ncbi:MAG TPA: tRNA 2-thiouridine(34) synthase MnmA [Fibrobacteria bacterium]|nr:tRNA 2-thiouridine(34) synthase MnmA [Fibrobacteria bacterium]
MEQSKQNALVAVAMSGGVDSSVAALLIKRAGYRAVGITMKLWSPPAQSAGSPAQSAGSPVQGAGSSAAACETGADAEKTCCTADSAMDAKRVCDQIGIPHFTLDMQEDFEERVIRPFYESYLAGETPNPCVNCNSFVKWDALWKRAKAVGADYIATGHYAMTEAGDGRTYILRGGDAAKDQSYFLWGIPPETLGKTLFPLARLTKPEVRKLALESGLRTAAKRESQDICFIPDGDYREFIGNRAREKGAAIPEGRMRGPDGRDLGPHRGLPFYTIGQRKGLGDKAASAGAATGEALYVKKLDRAANTLLLAKKEELYSAGFKADRANFFEPLAGERECSAQYRYRSPVKGATVRDEGNGWITVTFKEPGYCVSPGQSAVFYDGDRLLGGARIRETF